jgi:hypothetical protein
VASKPSATAPVPRRLWQRQTDHLVLNMAYGHASAPNGPSSLPRSTMLGLATRMVLKLLRVMVRMRIAVMANAMEKS